MLRKTCRLLVRRSWLRLHLPCTPAVLSVDSPGIWSLLKIRGLSHFDILGPYRCIAPDARALKARTRSKKLFPWRPLGGRIPDHNIGKIVSNSEAAHHNGGHNTIGLKLGTSTCTIGERSRHGVKISAEDISSSEDGSLCYPKSEGDGGSSRSGPPRVCEERTRGLPAGFTE
jgi:hypothetical protein